MLGSVREYFKFVGRSVKVIYCISQPYFEGFWKYKFRELLYKIIKQIIYSGSFIWGRQGLYFMIVRNLHILRFCFSRYSVLRLSFICKIMGHLDFKVSGPVNMHLYTLKYWSVINNVPNCLVYKNKCTFFVIHQIKFSIRLLKSYIQATNSP